MLKDEVIEAVNEGMFHIWAVKSIDEGIEILTGMEAGERNSKGDYPPKTVNYLIEKKLDTLFKNYSKYHIKSEDKKKKI